MTEAKPVAGDPTSGATTIRGIDAPQLSALLFRCREELDMLADIVENRTRKPARQTRGLVARIDQLRELQGWNPHGFGNEGERPHG
jgi:hypothetical protein